MYFIGIDGGGTKTSYGLGQLDSNGQMRMIREVVGANTFYLAVGFDGVYANLVRDLQKLIVGIDKSQIAALVMGVPAFGEIAADMPPLKQSIHRAIVTTIGEIKYELVNDMEVAWAGALNMQPGINIVAGTGSIAYGRDNVGQANRTGGWGHEIGDEGSACWFGKKVMEIFSKQSDGRLIKTPIYRIIKEHFKLKDDFDVIDIYLKMTRTELGQLYMFAIQAYEQDDTTIRNLFELAAKELAMHAQCLVLKGKFSSPIKVSGTGGVYKAGAKIVNPLKRELKKFNCEWFAPIFNPTMGALLLAKNLH